MSSREARFRALFDECWVPVLAYARRRCRSDADAHDVAADTFVVAWRRLDDAPAGDRARLWLFGVARRCLLNQERGRRRRLRLVERLAGELPVPSPAVEHDERADEIRAALGALRPDDREILRLAAWEGLSHGEIAVVLDVSVNAVAIRLHRARRRLAAELAKATAAPGHVGNVAPEET